MNENRYVVYMLASDRNGTIYTGMSGRFEARLYEHKNELVDGFTKRYGVNKLVHYEIYQTALEAIQREKNIKKWPRQWKLNLIEENNPQWRDLYEELNK